MHLDQLKKKIFQRALERRGLKKTPIQPFGILQSEVEQWRFGNMNLSSTFWEFWALFEGPAVSYLLQAFLKDWVQIPVQ